MILLFDCIHIHTAAFNVIKLNSQHKYFTQKKSSNVQIKKTHQHKLNHHITDKHKPKERCATLQQ